MLVKCICTNCSGHLEFEEEHAGERIKCPHCGWETALLDSATAAEAEGGDTVGPGWLKRHSRKLYFGLGVAAALGLMGFAGQRWILPRLEESFPFAEGSLMLWTVLIGGLWAVVLLAIWTITPILVFLQLRKVTAVLSQLEIISRPAPATETQEVVGPRVEEG